MGNVDMTADVKFMEEHLHYVKELNKHTPLYNV